MKKLLVVVDYQKDFVDGSLGFPGAEKLLPYILDLINEYDVNGDDVVFTKDTHSDNYLSTIEGKHLPVKHCIPGTPGYAFYGPLEEISQDHLVFDKPTFGSAKLFDYLREHNYEEITLVGLVSNICVLSNAVLAKTALPESHILVDTKGADSFDKEMQAKGYDILRNLHISVI
ncbi:MAG TPA: isochorismatase family cysteine hydrolase [Bacilli bacterium]|nr:isochorismatase family cysteine hydrolase [Bacilli bacterium]